MSIYFFSDKIKAFYKNRLLQFVTEKNGQHLKLGHLSPSLYINVEANGHVIFNKCSSITNTEGVGKD